MQEQETEDLPFSGKSQRKLYKRGYLFAIVELKKSFFQSKMGKAFQAESTLHAKTMELDLLYA